MTQQQWANDPDVMRAMAAARVRRGLWMNTLLWMPLFVLFFGLFIFFLADRIFDYGKGSTGFLIFVVGVMAALFGFQGFQSLFDLLSSPREREGFVTRRWARSDSFVLKSHYIRMDKQILRIERAFHDDIKEGDYVKITYYHHSAVVIHADRLPPPEGERYVASVR